MLLLRQYQAYLEGVVVLVILCLCLWAGWWVQGLRKDNTRLVGANAELTDALENSRKLRNAEQVVALKYASDLAALQKQKGTTDASVRKAVAANPAWSNQIVPPDVVDALGL